MILIDKKQFTNDEIVELFDLPFNKIEKTPEFDLNEKRKNTKKFGQSKEISSPAGTRVHAFFNVKYIGKDTRFNGKTIEIRYAESINQVPMGDKMVDQYYPIKVMFAGEAMLVNSNDIDLALFFYLHPLQETSPFRSQLKEKFHWSFKDMEARGKVKMAKVNVLREALNEVDALSGEKLKIVAKGFGVAGVDSLEPITIQGELSDMAQRNPALFLEKIGKKDIMFRGLILNGIDRGLFKTQNIHNNKSWIWGIGQFQGNKIIDIIPGSTPDVDLLVNHIMANINNYYASIIDISTTLNATQVASSYLDKMDFDLDKALGTQPNSAEVDKIPVKEETPIGGSTNDIKVTDNGNQNTETLSDIDNLGLGGEGDRSIVTELPVVDKTDKPDETINSSGNQEETPEFLQGKKRTPEVKKP
jgi:hypothetical protein